MDIQTLLVEVKAINELYVHLAKQTGSSFNIFELLKVKTNEVRLHSAFLAEFLDTKGSHSQGDKYLKLFLDSIKIKGYDTEKSTIEVEKYTGRINEDKTEGGNIDIILNDSTQAILIENKIYAPDQEAQLVRYAEFANKQYKPIHLFYLTLNGKEPSGDSKRHLKEDEYKNISYDTVILEWLSSCYTESIALPSIRETIFQYIQVIRKLTHKIPSNEMNMEIVNKIVENIENFEAAKLIQSAYNDCIKSIHGLIRNDLNNKLANSEFVIEDISEVQKDLKIELHAGEDQGGFYLALRMVSERTKNKFTVNSAEFITKQQAETIHKGLYDKLVKNFNNIRPDINSSNWSVAWYNPKNIGKGNRLENIESGIFIGLLNDSKRAAFIDEMLTETMDIISRYKNTRI